jgi:carbon monoxide dehydrogenase subunit G
MQLPTSIRMLVALACAGSVLAFGLPASAIAAEDAGWALVVERNGIEVYARALPGSAVKEVRATTEIAVPPAQVFAILLDSDKFVEFMPYIVEVRTVARDSPAVWYLYQRISPPFVSNRDYTLRHQSFEEPQRGRYELRWEAANGHGPAARGGVVRVEICAGSYIVEGLDGGARTRLTYQLHTDPGGSLPKWVINLANVESVPALLQAIARRAVDPGWHR